MRWKVSANKYGNHKTNADGITFDSKHEAVCYLRLKCDTNVKDLRLQVRYELVPKTDAFRAVYYVADFVYQDSEGRTHVCDAKGIKTDVFRLKEKLFYARYGQKIEIL